MVRHLNGSRPELQKLGLSRSIGLSPVTQCSGGHCHLHHACQCSKINAKDVHTTCKVFSCNDDTTHELYFHARITEKTLALHNIRTIFDMAIG